MSDSATLDRRVSLVIAVVTAAFAVPLLAASALLAIKAVEHFHDRTWFLVLSFPLTFALVFSVVAVRGFASIRHSGPALSLRGWRLLAGALVVVALVGAYGHPAGALFPLLIAGICLLRDPAVAKWMHWI